MEILTRLPPELVSLYTLQNLLNAKFEVQWIWKKSVVLEYYIT
jgi:hypothetical protein